MMPAMPAVKDVWTKHSVRTGARALNRSACREASAFPPIVHAAPTERWPSEQHRPRPPRPLTDQQENLRHSAERHVSTPWSALQINTSKNTRERYTSSFTYFVKKADRRCDEAACAPVALSLRHAVSPYTATKRQHHDPTRGPGQVGVRDVVHDLVLDGQRRQLLTFNITPCHPEQACQSARINEPRQSEPCDQRSMEVSIRVEITSAVKASLAHQGQLPWALLSNSAGYDAENVGDEAGREIDLAEEQREDLCPSRAS